MNVRHLGAVAALGLMLSAAPAFAQSATTTESTTTTTPVVQEHHEGFPWGLLGLVGLVGLFGLRKREQHQTIVRDTTTTRSASNPTLNPNGSTTSNTPPRP